MSRKGCRLAAFLSVIVLCVPAMAAEENSFMFFGVVTVRDGKTVLIGNPELSQQQAAACRALLEGTLELDRTFTTGRNENGELRHTWGDDEGALAEEGLVPYIAYFVTPGQFINTDDAEAEPCELAMGSSTSSMSDVAMVSWWAPETAKTCDIAIRYYDESSYKTVVKLEGEAIAVGAFGTSHDGVSWKIARIEEKENNVVIAVETGKGPEGHQFTFRIVTTDWETPQDCSCWAEETEDGKGLLYPVSCWVESTKQVVSLEIRERHPDRIKQWAVKAFSLTPRQ